MSYSSITAGAAFIRISLQDAALRKGLDSATKRMDTFGQRARAAMDKVRMFAAQSLDSFLTLGAPIQHTVSQFTKFDDTLRTLRAVSGSSAQQLAGVEKKIRALGKSTAFTAQQIAEGAVELSRMGFETNELDDSLEPMLNLVRATGEETFRLKEISEYTAASMRIFQLRSDKVSDVCDVLAYAANRSSVDIGDLGHSMKIAGPSAKAINEDLRDTAAALMLMSNAGIKGELAGTSLRKIYQSLAAVSGQTEGFTQTEINEGIRGKGQLQEMGIKIVSEDGNLRKAADIMMDIAKYVKEMKTGEKINFATDVFDLRGSLGALTMLADSSKLKDFRNELNNVSGYAQKTAKAIDSGVGQAFRKFNAELNNLKLSAGDFLGQALLPLVQGLGPIVKGMADIIKDTGSLSKTFTSVTFSVIAFGAGLRGLIAVADAVKTGFSPLFKTIGKLDELLVKSFSKKGKAPGKEDIEKASETATANAEKIKAAATRKASAERKVEENKRHLQELYNAREAQEVVAAGELKKLNEKKRAVEQAKALETNQLNAVRARCDMELAAERKMLALKQAERARVEALNEKLRYQYTLEHGSSQGYKDVPELKTADKELLAQEKIVAAKEKAAARSIAAAEKESAIRLAAMEKEIAMQQKVVNSSIDKTKKSYQETDAASQKYKDSLDNLSAVSEKYNETMSQASTTENVLAEQKEKLNQKDLRRGKAIARITNNQKTLFQWNSKGNKLNKIILATSDKAIISAYKEAGSSTAAAIAKTAWSKANARLALSFRAVGAAMAANPIGAILTVLSLVITAVQAVVGWMKKMRKEAYEPFKIRYEMQERWTQQRNEKRHSAETNVERLKQLEEISQQTELSAEQMAEAEELINRLAPFGSSEWVNLDKTAKKISIAGNAIEELYKKVADSKIKDEEKRIKEYDAALKKLLYTQKTVPTKTVTVMDPEGNVHTVGTEYKKIDVKREENDLTEEEKAERDKLLEQRRNAQLEIKKTKADARYALTGKEKTTADKVEEQKRKKAAKAEEIARAEKDLAKLEADAAKNNRTNLQQEIFEIDEKRKALEKYIETLKKGKNADIEAIEKRKKAMEEALNAEESQARQKAAEEDAKILEELDEANKRDKEEKAKKAFEKMFNKKLENKDFDTLLPALDKMLSGQRTALAEAEKMIRETVAWEPTDKFSQEQRAKQIAEYQKIAEEARAKKNEIESKIEQAKDAQEQALKTDSQQGLKTQGSWSLKNLSMALGGGTAAEQTAYNTKESVKLQKKTNKALDEIKKNNSQTYGA